MGGWWRWALVSSDGVVPSQMIGVSASVNLPLHHKVEKFSSGTGSPGLSQKKGRKTVVVCGVVLSKVVMFTFCCRQWLHCLPVAHRRLLCGKSQQAIVDHTLPTLCTPVTPFIADPICSEHVTMHCQWGRKPPKLPLTLGISSPCQRRTEPRP